MAKLTAVVVEKLRKRARSAGAAMAKQTAAVVEKLRKRVEAGDGAALLDAVDFCARAGMAMPVWLREAYCSRYEDWLMFRARTLDDAFGVAAIRKNRKIPNLRQRERLKAAVVLTAQYLHKETGLPFDEELFWQVGQRLKISRSVANEIFYAADNPWRKLIGHWAKDPRLKASLTSKELPGTSQSSRQYRLPNL